MRHLSWHRSAALLGLLTSLAGAGCDLPAVGSPPAAKFKASTVSASSTSVSAATQKAATQPTATQSADAQSKGADGRAHQERILQVLQAGLNRLEGCDGYTASFYRQERVDGELLDPETMELKVRHEPYSVFLEWPDARRQASYVTGENDNKLLVRSRGLLSAVGTMKLDPEGSMALRESRYPITQVGLLPLTKCLITHYERDLKQAAGIRCDLQEVIEHQRPCLQFTIVYASSELDETYQKSIVCIDKELSLPISVRNFGWTESTEEPLELIEHYAYSNLDLNCQLSRPDFEIASRR